MKLAEKTAIVTGATRGIGRAIALGLAGAGANIVVNYKNNEKDADDVIEEISAMGAKAIPVRADVAQAKEVERIIESALAKFGTVDILVNNAGGSQKNRVIEMDEREWDEIINFNLKGAFLCSKSVLPVMIKKRYGKIISISSNYGATPADGRSHYAAAKAGLVAFSKTLAMEVAADHINVNVVAPGPTDTPRWRSKHTEEWIAERARQIPFGRVARPKDVANCVLFLASEASSYITGQVVHVNGGLVMP